MNSNRFGENSEAFGEIWAEESQFISYKGIARIKNRGRKSLLFLQRWAAWKRSTVKNIKN